MSVTKGKTESRQQQVEKMKRWLAEREDRLDAEMVQAKMQAILAERRQKPKSPK